MSSLTDSSPQERFRMARSFLSPFFLKPSSLMNRGLRRRGTIGSSPRCMKAPVFCSSLMQSRDFFR